MVSKQKRGLLKAFREYLNAKYAASEVWRNCRYHQSTRGYGDYLYFQDRDMFNVLLADAEAFPDFDFKWRKQ